MLFIYRLIILISTPLIHVYLAIRKIRGKEDKERFAERMGEASVPRPDGKLFWFHAASVGEVNSIMPLIDRLLVKYPAHNILVTTGTVTSAKLMEKRLPPRCIHQYVPVDMQGPVKKFIKHWQPDIALWVESELWPNLITEVKNSGCTMLLVNARMSDRSYKKWRFAKPLAKKLLSAFSLCLPQTQEDGSRFIQLGATVKYIGNLKAEGKPLVADPKAYAEALFMFSDRTNWLAASTHRGEEKIIAEVHKKLKTAHPEILTVIVPRHSNRGAEVKAIVEKQGLTTAMRSAGESIKPTTDIYIADTMGELGVFYRICQTVFMGGSLIKHGGQNPFEPARLECAIISGPNCFNFSNIYREMEQKNAAIVVETPDKLAFVVSRLIFDYESRKLLSDSAHDFVEAKSGVADSFIKEIALYAK